MSQFPAETVIVPTQTPGGRGTGWIRDQLDPHDFRWQPRSRRPKAIPATIDHRPKMPPVLDQGSLGSCTANSVANYIDFRRIQLGLPPLRGSRLFQYYNSRAYTGATQSDNGASIRDAVKAVVDWGTCPETMWPYDIPRYRERPPSDCYIEAEKSQVLTYERLTTGTFEEMEAALYEGAEEEPGGGSLIVFGMLLFRQFETVGSDGVIKMPSASERPIGAHSQLGCGKISIGVGGTRYLISQNTWSTDHGDNGYVYIPEAYVTNRMLADDFWLVRTIEREEPPLPPPAPPSPWDLYHVGEDIRRLMVAHGDVPLHREGYSANEMRENVGWSLIHAWNPITGAHADYRYILSTPRRIIRTPVPPENVTIL